MKTKLKYLFLALLGLILIPNTNAYELGTNLNWTNSDYDVEYEDAKFTFYNSSYPYIVARPCSDSSQGSKCFSAPYDSSSIFDYSYRIHVSLSSWSFEKFFGVAYKDNWEWRDFYYSAYSDNKAVQKLFNVPSRTAFSVKMTNGKEYIMDTVYFYHNTLVFMDSRNGFTLYLNGNLKASDWVVFVDPFLKEDNLFFIRFKEKKAWSMTVSEPEAWNWFFGKKNWDVLKTLKFTKSYEVREWGDTIFPINFHVWKNKQGWPWYTYQEDIEFVSPEWNAWSNNNQNQTGQNQALVEYNACFKYYNSIKKYTSYNYNCYKTLLDTAPLTWSYDSKKILKPWQEIEDWDWESDFAVSTENVVCNSFARVKRDYKQQYKEKWEDFLKVSSENFFYPHTMDIKWYCGERPKVDKVEWWLIQSMKNWFEWMRDKFNWNSGEPITVYSGKNYYKLDYDSALADLKIEYSHCKGMGGFRELIVDKDTIESEKKRACERYELKKKEFNKIFWWLKWVVNSTWAIQKIEDWNASDIGQGQKFVNVITDPYYSGFNSVNLVPALCSGPKNDFFNIFFYLFFFGVVLYLFKIFT